MKIGPDGLLYVLQWNGNGKVRRYQLDGTYLGEFTATGVAQSIGMDWDTNGSLYVSSYGAHIVRKFDTNGNDLGSFISTNLLGPTNIWFDDNGELLVADYNGTSVNRFDSQGNFIGPFITGLSQCEGVAFMPNGNILIGNGGTNSVKMFDSNGGYLQDLISPGSGNLLNPNAVVLRMVTGSAIPEFGTYPSVILYPTTGREFYVSQGYLNQIDRLHIYTMAGNFVRTIIVNNDALPIRLSELPEGMYIVKATLKSSRETLQRIIVLNNYRTF